MSRMLTGVFFVSEQLTMSWRKTGEFQCVLITLLATGYWRSAFRWSTYAVASIPGKW